ncbi:MAG TPA: DUF2007 domain-containing protein [Acidobacteriaceae bacterium]
MQSEEGQDQEQLGKMVEVARFESPVEAQIAKGMLESAGIDGELTGENANQLIQAAFDVQLEVRAEDESAARELLEAAGEKTGKETGPSLVDLDAGVEEG